jgi:hypothetical protein
LIEEFFGCHWRFRHAFSYGNRHKLSDRQQIIRLFF